MVDNPSEPVPLGFGGLAETVTEALKNVVLLGLRLSERGCSGYGSWGRLDCAYCGATLDFPLPGSPFPGAAQPDATRPEAQAIHLVRRIDAFAYRHRPRAVHQ